MRLAMVNGSRNNGEKAVRVVAVSLLVAVFLLILAMLGAHQVKGFELDPLDGNSMLPTLQSGALIAMVEADPGQVHQGDIIGFYVPSIDTRVCHRVIGTVQTRHGEAFITQGDGNPEPDGWVVYPGDITGKFWFDASWLLPVANFVASSAGTLLLKVLPVLAAVAIALRVAWHELRKRRSRVSSPGQV
jgi:signal peptidase I